MHICLDCGILFENPKHHTETHGLDSPPYETWSGCPECGGTYVETARCDDCGEWITGEFVELNGGQRICEQCYTVKDVADM